MTIESNPFGCEAFCDPPYGGDHIEIGRAAILLRNHKAKTSKKPWTIKKAKQALIGALQADCIKAYSPKQRIWVPDCEGSQAIDGFPDTADTGIFSGRISADFWRSGHAIECEPTDYPLKLSGDVGGWSTGRFRVWRSVAIGRLPQRLLRLNNYYNSHVSVEYVWEALDVTIGACDLLRLKKLGPEDKYIRTLTREHERKRGAARKHDWDGAIGLMIVWMANNRGLLDRTIEDQGKTGVIARLRESFELNSTECQTPDDTNLAPLAEAIIAAYHSAPMGYDADGFCITCGTPRKKKTPQLLGSVKQEVKQEAPTVFANQSTVTNPKHPAIP